MSTAITTSAWDFDPRVWKILCENKNFFTEFLYCFYISILESILRLIYDQFGRARYWTLGWLVENYDDILMFVVDRMRDNLMSPFVHKTYPNKFFLLVAISSGSFIRIRYLKTWSRKWRWKQYFVHCYTMRGENVDQVYVVLERRKERNTFFHLFLRRTNDLINHLSSDLLNSVLIETTSTVFLSNRVIGQVHATKIDLSFSLTWLTEKNISISIRLSWTTLGVFSVPWSNPLALADNVQRQSQ